jgi:hypothetical protein
LPEATTVKRLALLALLFATSSLVAAPAPMPKLQWKAEPQPKKVILENRLQFDGYLGGQYGALFLAAQLAPPPPQKPAQPPNADPPG